MTKDHHSPAQVPPDPDVDLLVRIIDAIWHGAATQPHVLQHLAKARSAAKISTKEKTNG